MVEQIFRNLAARFSYCLFPSQIMNWHRVRQGTVTVKNVSLIAFFRSSEDGHTRRDHATNVNERQRTSTTVNERQCARWFIQPPAEMPMFFIDFAAGEQM